MVDLTHLAVQGGSSDRSFACMTFRPGLRAFLQDMAQQYDLAVWTAASQRSAALNLDNMQT